MRMTESITHTARTMIERDEETARGPEQEKKKKHKTFIINEGENQ